MEIAAIVREIQIAAPPEEVLDAGGDGPAARARGAHRGDTTRLGRSVLPWVIGLLLVLSFQASVGSAPAGLPEGGDVDTDLAYGPHGRHRLDLYLRPGPGPHPLIVFIHGGGHVVGDKSSFGLQLILPFVSRAGYSVASINYRLAPAHRHPAQVEDARTAVRWLRANAARFRIDPDRVAVSGASAGGHIATFLAFTPCAGDPAGDAVARQSCRPVTVVNFFGTTDLRARRDPFIDALLGRRAAPEAKAAASPITLVTPDDPPTLSLHGTADRLVPYRQSVALHETLSAAGVANRLITVEGGGHGGNWLWHRDASRWQDDLIGWLDAYLGP